MVQPPASARYQSTLRPSLPPLPGANGMRQCSSAGALPTPDPEPIADFEPALRLRRRTTQRPELILTVRPPLPAPSAPGFDAALEAKLAIIESECCWDDPEADLSAKKIKTDTLKELIEFVRPESEPPPCIVGKLIPAVERPIFRPWSDLDPIFVRSDDMIAYSEVTWPHLSLHYQLLNRIVATFPGEPRFGEESYLRMVIERFRMPDVNERTALAALLTEICASRPAIRDRLLQLVLFAAVDSAERQRSPYVTCPALIVALHCFSNPPPTPNNTTDLPLYFEYILPLLGTLHYGSFKTQIGAIIELFVRGVPALAANPTMQAMLSRFPQTRSAKAIEFIRLLTIVITKTPRSHIKANMRRIVLLYTRCMTLGQVKLAAMATIIWSRIEIESLIMDNARSVFPLLYPILRSAEHEAWCSDISASIEEVFRVFNCIDSSVFQDLCRGKIAPIVSTSLSEMMKTWASIARTAAKFDSELPLVEKMAEIQKEFSPPKRIRTYQSVISSLQLRPAVKQASEPLTSLKPLAVRSELRPMVRCPT
jgi:hypothetical protein